MIEDPKSADNPFVSKVISARNLQGQSVNEQSNQTLPLLYTRLDYSRQLLIVERSGLLDNLRQWVDYNKPDSQLLISDPETGRFVANLRWNPREIKRRGVYDEVGIACITRTEADLTQFRSWRIDWDRFRSFTDTYSEPTNFLLIWGQRANIYRYNPNGELLESVYRMIDESVPGNGEASYEQVEIKKLFLQKPLWDLLEPFSFRKETKAICSLIGRKLPSVDIDSDEDIEMILLQGEAKLDFVFADPFETNIKALLRKIRESRLKSNQVVEQALIQAINNPYLRYISEDGVRSPYFRDDGKNTFYLLGNLESKIVTRMERQRQARIDRLLKSSKKSEWQKAVVLTETEELLDDLYDEEDYTELEAEDSSTEGYDEPYYHEHPVHDLDGGCSEGKDGYEYHDPHCTESNLD